MTISLRTLIAPAVAATLGFAALPAFAVGSNDDTPPAKTNTTTVCTDGQVWDEQKKECVTPQKGSFNDDQLYRFGRELAYDGQYENAIAVLSLASNPNDPGILNYLGFSNRKAGRLAQGMEYYQRALALNPDYVLARSYMGQGLVSEGDFVGALHQLREIEARAGTDTYAWVALDRSIRTATGY